MKKDESGVKEFETANSIPVWSWDELPFALSLTTVPLVGLIGLLVFYVAVDDGEKYTLRENYLMGLALIGGIFAVLNWIQLGIRLFGFRKGKASLEEGKELMHWVCSETTITQFDEWHQNKQSAYVRNFIINSMIAAILLWGFCGFITASQMQGLDKADIPSMSVATQVWTSLLIYVGTAGLVVWLFFTLRKRFPAPKTFMVILVEDHIFVGTQWHSIHKRLSYRIKLSEKSLPSGNSICLLNFVTPRSSKSGKDNKREVPYPRERKSELELAIQGLQIFAADDLD